MKKLFALMLLGMTVIVCGCGGGGGGGGTAAVTVPTDPATISTTTSRSSVQSVASVAMPFSVAAPSTVGRMQGRVAGRILKSVTSNMGNMTGTVGETFYITYSDEPSGTCIVNGTINGTLTSLTSLYMVVTMSGTIYYTECEDMPDSTMTVTNGTITINNTQAITVLPTTMSFPGKTYRASLTYTTVDQAYGDTLITISETYAGSDNIGSVFDNGFSYSATTGHVTSSYNRNKIGGTTNNISCAYALSTHTASCSGTSTASNNIIITKRTGAADAWMVFDYSEVGDISSDSISYDVYLDGGSVLYGTNTGYYGGITLNSDGSGNGTLWDSAGTAVASFTWGTDGICSVDYASASVTDEQFYLSPIQQALGG